MQNITTEEVMDKLDMFQAKFVKVDKFRRFHMERIKTNIGTHFTSNEFREGLSIHGV